MRLAARLRRSLFSLQGVVAFILAWILNVRFFRWFVRKHPVSGDTRVSARWLTQVLRDSAVIGKDNEVTAVELADLSGNRGFAGAMARVLATYKVKTDSAPASFILKRSPADLNVRTRTIIGGHVREAIFYSKSAIAPPGFAPRSFFSYSSHLLGEYTMLLEDLELIKTVPVTYVFGNQIWGIKDPISPPIDAVGMLKLIYARNAEMHAAHWRSKALLEMRWLKHTEWYRGEGREKWEIAIEFARQCWQKTVVALDAAGAKPAWNISPRLRHIVELSFRNASWDELQRHLHDPAIPWTLTHGDLHSANMRFQPHASQDITKGRPFFFDYSEIGPWEPTADLGQILISDVKPEIFRAHSKELLRGYWQRLGELGVDTKAYTFEQCWSAFCRGATEKWVWMFAIMCSFPVPPTLLQYFNDQIIAYIDAHDPQPFYKLKPVVCIT